MSFPASQEVKAVHPILNMIVGSRWSLLFKNLDSLFLA